jgi:hypothetical protein
MDLHGGTIEANSEGEGLGAAFKARLPRRIATTETALTDSANSASLADASLAESPNL